MTFFRVNPYYSTYTLSGYVIDKIIHAVDHGVYMDPKLKFSDHITTMVNKPGACLHLSKGGRRNSMIHISQRPCLFH